MAQAILAILLASASFQLGPLPLSCRKQLEITCRFLGSSRRSIGGRKMMNIVVPMAGRGSRFAGAENGVPKPLIQVRPGKPMIDYVIEYLTLSEPHRFIFI